jgi:hypothetical protein
MNLHLIRNGVGTYFSEYKEGEQMEGEKNAYHEEGKEEKSNCLNYFSS